MIDVGDLLHVGVPASDLLPSRRARDADYVAHLLRVLAEPTRVTVLIQLLAGPAAVMPLARRLGIRSRSLAAISRRS